MDRRRCKCKWCGMNMAAPIGAQTIICPRCQSVTQLQPPRNNSFANVPPANNNMRPEFPAYPPGATLHGIIDACFSGTFLDLPFLCRINRAGYFKWEDHRIRSYKGTSGGTAFSISACDDHQCSGDTTAFTGVPMGALTYSFIQMLEQETKLTYGRLIMSMHNKIHEAQKGLGLNGANETQEPQLSSSEPFDIHSKLVAI